MVCSHHIDSTVLSLSLCFVSKVPWDWMHQELGPLAQTGSCLLQLPKFWIPHSSVLPSEHGWAQMGEGQDWCTAKGTESSHGGCPKSIPVPKRAQQQMANFKRRKDHGRKENAFPSLLFDQGAPPFHFALSCANSVYAVELPAWDCCAPPRPTCPVTAAVDCHHDRRWANFAPKSFPTTCRGKVWLNDSGALSGEVWNVGHICSTEQELYQGRSKGKSCFPEIPLDADFPACWFPLQCGIRVKVPMWYLEKSNHDNSQVHRESSRMYWAHLQYLALPSGMTAPTQWSSFNKRAEGKSRPGKPSCAQAHQRLAVSRWFVSSVPSAVFTQSR